jgi:hypothetical protein
MASRRSTSSIKLELVRQSREAALNAVQTYNNPLIGFKSQAFIVLMTIAWTYLLHAYYRAEKVEYRYRNQGSGRRKFARTKQGSLKYWDLEQCLNAVECPLDEGTKSNMRFLLELRHRVEHRMIPGLDNSMSSRYQACALNYCHYLTKLFGEGRGIEQLLTYSLQFSAFSTDQVKGIPVNDELPASLQSFIKDFDSSLPDSVFNSPQFAAKIILARQTVNHRNQADATVEFVDYNADFGEFVEKPIMVVKDRERPKFKAGDVVQAMRDQGFPKFSMTYHTRVWQAKNARNGTTFGTWVTGEWRWYETWFDVVRTHCEESGDLYR